MLTSIFYFYLILHAIVLVVSVGLTYFQHNEPWWDREIWELHRNCMLFGPLYLFYKLVLFCFIEIERSR